MEYEIHVTVDTNAVVLFVNHCKEIGVKPIVIETQKENSFNNQVMTSSKYSDDHYLDTLRNISSSLKDKSYKILRQKVEIRPLEVKHNNFIYYESHLRLKLDKDFDYTNLKLLCKELNFHLSKNLFKKAEDFSYQMITYRSYTDSLTQFIKIIDVMKKKLTDLSINFDKIEIEECIFDSNVNVDNNWI